MFLFLKLVLGHLIADFILQFEELYRLKVKSRLGHGFHAGMHFICYVLLSVPYLGSPFIWIFISAVSIIHYLQDLLKYRLQEENPKQIFWCFTVDQVFHFIFLTLILFFPISREPRGFPGHPNLDFIYRSRAATFYAVAFITATFKGSYLLHAFRHSFFKKTRPDHFITSLEVWHGILERGFVVSVFLFNIPSFALMIAWPAVAIVRAFSKKLRSLPDFFLSVLYASLVGILFRSWR